MNAEHPTTNNQQPTTNAGTGNTRAPRTLVGIVTFGNLAFTQLAAQSVRATAPEVDIFVIVGKPDDRETLSWLAAQAGDADWLRCLIHTENKGFPASCNDLVEAAFSNSALRTPHSALPYEHLVIMGNDVIAYPGAIQALVNAADAGWEWCCSSQYDVRSLCRDYPAAREHFGSEAENFKTKPTTFAAQPWNLHLPAVAAARARPHLVPHAMSDVQNLCLYKRSVIDKIGYFDVNFWPNGYFSDNDFCLRGTRAGLKACAVANSAYFHFWSRTIHEGGGDRPVQFHRNAEFYNTKWGGPVNAEKFSTPFNGMIPLLNYRTDTRQHEETVIEYWRDLQ